MKSKWIKKFKSIVITLLNFVMLIFLSCSERKDVNNNQNTIQQNVKQPKENVQEKLTEKENHQNNQLNNQQDSNQNTKKQNQLNQLVKEKESKSKKQFKPINFFWDDDDNFTESQKDEIKDMSLDAVKIIISNKEGLAKVYQEAQMQFVITSNIKRVADKFHAPLTMVPGIIKVDSFSFDLKSKDDGSVQYFTVLDKEVFASFVRLIVTINHETIHMKHYVFNSAKEEYLDEEIQTYVENVDDLQDLYKSLDLKETPREMTKELNELILKERNVGQVYQKAKILRQLK